MCGLPKLIDSTVPERRLSSSWVHAHPWCAAAAAGRPSATNRASVRPAKPMAILLVRSAAASPATAILFAAGIAEASGAVESGIACRSPPAGLACHPLGRRLPMAEGTDISAWIALFLGLYALAASAGELRSPNTWWTMLKDFERIPAFRFVTGFVTLALGTAIYLA